MHRTKITLEELENESCEILPNREELTVVDTGFTNPSLAAGAQWGDMGTSGYPYNHENEMITVPPRYVPYQPPVVNQPVVYYPNCDWNHDWNNNDWDNGDNNDGKYNAKPIDYRQWDRHDGWNNDWNDNNNYRTWQPNTWNTPNDPYRYA